jgi:hypothetical protein
MNTLDKLLLAKTLAEKKFKPAPYLHLFGRDIVIQQRRGQAMGSPSAILALVQEAADADQLWEKCRAAGLMVAMNKR